MHLIIIIIIIIIIIMLDNELINTALKLVDTNVLISKFTYGIHNLPTLF